MRLTVRRLAVETARPFRISRGTTTRLEVVICEVAHGGAVGRGEASPAPGVTGETAASVTEWLEGQRRAVEGLHPDDWEAFLDDAHDPNAEHPPSARCALDLALHDLTGRLEGRPAHALYGLDAGRLPTTMTVSLDAPEAMAAEAREYLDRGFTHLKLKLGDGPHDAQRVAAVREAAPDAVLRADANQGWSEGEARVLLPELAAYDLELVEQPVAADNLEGLVSLADVSPVPVYADESVLGAGDVAALQARGFTGGVNLKLQKTGGLRPAVAAARAARDGGMGVQLGCNLETGLAISAGAQLLSLLDHADLDGNLLLKADPFTGPPVSAGVVATPRGAGLGAEPRGDG